MDTQHYRHFLAVVEAGSMTAAADYVHVTQPALSKQIHALENFFGMKLILTNRGSKKLLLTDAGEILYHKAKYICSLEDNAMSEIDELRDGGHGTLRFSVANSRSTAFIRHSLKPFHKLFPNIVFELYEGGLKEQYSQLLNGITEIGILSVPPVHQSEFEILFRREESMGAIFTKDSRYAKGLRKDVSVERLAAWPLCLSAGCYMRLMPMFGEQKLTPQILAVCTTRTAILNWVDDDCGVGVVPVDQREDIPARFRCVPVRDIRPPLFKTIVKVRSRPLSVVARKFIEFYGQFDAARKDQTHLPPVSSDARTEN